MELYLLIGAVIAYLILNKRDKNKKREEALENLRKSEQIRKQPIKAFKEEVSNMFISPKYEQEFTDLCKKFHVPEKECYFVVVYSIIGLYVNIEYTPAILWKDDDTIKCLLLTPDPFLYQIPIEKFSSVWDDTMAYVNHPYDYFLKNWTHLNPFIKRKFLPYLGEDKNTPNAFDHCVAIGGLVVPLASLRSVMKVVGKPSNEYRVTISKYNTVYREALKKYFPDQIYNTQNVKKSIDKIIQDGADYTEIQAFVNSKVEDETIKKSQMAECLNYAREKTESMST